MNTSRSLGKRLDSIGKTAFQVVSAATALLLLVALFFDLLYRPTSDAKLIGTLVASFFAAAFLAAFGKDLRVKKIGPVELLEVQRAARELDGISAEVIAELISDVGRISIPDVSFEPKKLSPAEKFYYAEGDKLLTHLKFSHSEPETGADRDIFLKLLLGVGKTAHSQREFRKAIRWLEHLETKSEGKYESIQVSVYIAFSFLFMTLGEESRGTQHVEGLRKAARRFADVADKQELDWGGYFWWAYAQDELEQWYEAVFSLLEALERRPRLAPARFNLAISLLKLGKINNAYWQLKNIRNGDDYVELVKEGATSDQEIRSLIEKIEAEDEKRRLLAELDRLSALRLD
jgi:tetratricopeptide (TPR) repeat protein